MKRMRIRRADRCAACGAEVAAGTDAWWDAAARSITCLACAGTTTVRQEPIASPRPDEPAAVVPGGEAEAAGASARQEYERRSARHRAKQEAAVADDLAWRQAAIARRPVLGRIATSVTRRPTVAPEGQTTTAWKVGAEGEERVAEVLTAVAGVEVLHDRRVPRSRANIDHVVVGPSGVVVIDAKKYAAGSAVEVRDVGGLLRTDRRLYVGGRDRTKLVDAVRGQVEVVRAALGPDLAHVPVRGALCFVGASWGWRMRTKTVGGVTAVWPKGLPDLVAGVGPYGDEVGRIAAQLRRALPPAGGLTPRRGR